MSQPTTIVIFGASGDLTKRKLIPALFNSFRKERLPQPIHIVGYARRPWDADQFRQILLEGMQELAPQAYREEAWPTFAQNLHYVQGDLSTAEDYAQLAHFLDQLDEGVGNRLYYMATSPGFFPAIVKNLGDADLVSEENGWRRVVVEKPFGQNLDSAHELNQTIHAVFQEHQIYRIDHYLGKETAQNILYFRFANTIFEPVWNRNYVNNIQVTVTEQVDVGHRAGYYDKAGVIRDMFQNHLMQLLSLITMEPPASFDADAIRNEKVKVLRSVRPIDLQETVRAQYDGYLATEGVAENSQTPTYAALKLYIDNWRWQGVPIYLRSGKSLARKNTELIIEFDTPPHLMFDNLMDEDFKPNILSICIQPDEGIHLTFEAKVPDAKESQSVDMEFHYRSTFKGNSLPDAYERLLLDAIRGDATLFTRSDGIEASWQIVDPVIAGWENNPEAPPMSQYAPGSEGPAEADALLAQTNNVWRAGCIHDDEPC